MLDATFHATLVTLAGPDFTYPGVRGGSRPPATWRTGLRNWLVSAQGGICPVCAGPVRNAQFNHVVSRGPGVKGFIEGNVFAGCATCNLTCAYSYGSVNDDGMVTDGGIIPLEAFKALEVIPTEWPGTATLKACK